MRRVVHLAMLLALTVAAVPVGAVPAAAQTSPPPVKEHEANECIGCHSIPDIQIADRGEYRPDLYVTPDAVMDSVHQGFACTTCHSKLEATMHARVDAARHSCVTCHEQENADYEAGYHGSEGEGIRPTCITCHGSHEVQDPRTREFVHRAAEQCARCHAQMGERFMGGNAFGMETHLAGQDVATCADCHGYHTVLPTENPASPVNEANILTTCRQCHSDAPANFADVQMHLADAPIPEDPRLRFITIYMLTLLIGTFGFFGYLTILGIRHEWRQQAGRKKTETYGGGVL